MTITTVPTFTANIYVGYKHRPTGELIQESVVRSAIQGYVDAAGLCVTFTPTSYIYTNGNELGVIVGLINYPRFPSTPEVIREHALAIAEMLLTVCRQFKVSVVMPDETVMLSSAEE